MDDSDIHRHIDELVRVGVWDISTGVWTVNGNFTTALGVTFTTAVAEKMGSVRALRAMTELYSELRKRGLRVLPGGDYGFPNNPIGRNARDTVLILSAGWANGSRTPLTSTDQDNLRRSDLVPLANHPFGRRS